jgi:hypothetical protein
MPEHKVTQEDIDAVKARLAKIAEIKGTPVPPVFKQTIAKNDFLYTWITEESYKGIVDKREFQEAMKRDQAGAEKYLQTMVIQECLLWPPTFNIADPKSTGLYPAGVQPSLMDSIMFSSGFTVDPSPEELIIPPKEAERISDEEVLQLVNKHSVAKLYGAHEKVFYIRSKNSFTGLEKLTPVRSYIYTSLTREDYKESQRISGEDSQKDFVVDKCVIWPQNINWGKEPAGYSSVLFSAILERSGFGAAGVEDAREV